MDDFPGVNVCSQPGYFCSQVFLVVHQLHTEFLETLKFELIQNKRCGRAAIFSVDGVKKRLENEMAENLKINISTLGCEGTRS